MKIGIIGGGQLGRMLALAGTPLGQQFAFLDPADDACAAALGEHLCADYDDREQLRQLADSADVVTFEFESVPAETVAFLEQFVPVYPNAESLRIARDRWFEKSMFQELGIPTPKFANVLSQAELDAAVQQIGLPAVLKTRTLGYDGKGQKVLRQPEDALDALLNWAACPASSRASCPLPVSLADRGARSRRRHPLLSAGAQHPRDGILRLSIAGTEHPLRPRRRTTPVGCWTS